MKRLEQAGLLARQRNTADERQVQVYLTAKGKGLRQKTRCLTDTLLERSGLTVDELTALNRKIQTLRDVLDQPERPLRRARSAYKASTNRLALSRTRSECPHTEIFGR